MFLDSSLLSRPPRLESRPLTRPARSFPARRRPAAERTNPMALQKFLVQGGARLAGNVRVSGSKNSALPILAATLLTREQCVVEHVPDLSDLNFMAQILSHLGAEVERASGTVRVDAAEVTSEAPYDLVRKMRASICVLGPLLARCGSATVALPGGCVIGDRPIDLHLRGMEALGAEVRVAGGNVHVTAPAGGRLRGAEINLRGAHGPTVLGTDNVTDGRHAGRGDHGH